MEKYLGVKLIEAEPWLGLNNKCISLDEEFKGDADLGYKVVYEDGYESWSPKDVFEKAYRRLDNFTFGLAIEAMNLGKCVARKGWNGSGMFVCKQVPSKIGVNIVPKMQSLPESAKVIFLDRIDKALEDGANHPNNFSTIDYNNQMIIVKSDNTIDSWVASSSDTFAEDWCIVE